ncbi:fb0eaa15-3ec0-41af-9d1b-ce512ebc861b [Thermothielavioides terrestris]|uniref:Fb0eaa15-3ec0-41af-9d1b-ce512ebc861b n=1 Tax=Thermothielavioides terrestris TaxID=2587410 RepID=A0A446BAG3_9PEZI|nr:fb0eaa15-3ec0-41af-9d1b-ce512ebc861b [Thermothielavioides terrestris]
MPLGTKARPMLACALRRCRLDSDLDTEDFAVPSSQWVAEPIPHN